MNEVKTYSRENLDKQKLWLQNMKATGYSKYYEILADGKRVVYKTDKIEEFDSYQTWVDEDTQSLRLLIYNTQNTHRPQIIEFHTEKYIEGKSQYLYRTRSKKLSEEEIKERVKAEVKELERERELIALREENIVLKKRLQDAEDYIDKKTNELDAIKSKESSGFEKTLELLVSKYYGLPTENATSTNNEVGLNGTDNIPNNEEEPTITIIKKKVPTSEENNTLSEIDTLLLASYHQALQILGTEYFKKNCDIFEFLTKNPVYINTVHEMVTSELKMG
jgi:hypothetical protein